DLANLIRCPAAVIALATRPAGSREVNGATRFVLAIDDVARTRFHFIEYLAHVFTNHAKEKQLHAPHEGHRGKYRGPAGHFGRARQIDDHLYKPAEKTEGRHAEPQHSTSPQRQLRK